MLSVSNPIVNENSKEILRKSFMNPKEIFLHFFYENPKEILVLILCQIYINASRFAYFHEPYNNLINQSIEPSIHGF